MYEDIDFDDGLSEDENIELKREKAQNELRLEAEIEHELNRGKDLNGPVKTYFIKIN